MRTGCIDDYLVSPRHAWHFATDAAVQRKIADRVRELRDGGRIAGKTPIVNIQDEPVIVELHDGNATAVAWRIHAREQGIEPCFERFARSVERIVVLRNRQHESGEIWHPFVPIDVASADRLAQLVDEEQGRSTCKALSRDGVPVYFDDGDYFAGDDAARPLGEVAAEVAAVIGV